MQYETTLPAAHDMGLVRARIAEKGPLTDGLPDLGVKAYLVRERGVDGSPVNQYAPFYLWTGPRGMNHFLWDGGFRSFSDAFGRPRVAQYLGLGFARGPAFGATPRGASRRTEPIPPDAEPAPILARALEELQERARLPGLHASALLIDTRGWAVVHFALWAQAAPAEAGTRYQVWHLSAPHLAALPVGRHW
jgi:hypothetical protein